MDPKEKILKHASELFMSMGIRYVTMDSIASNLGISKRTIYELFKDKEDLLIQSLSQMIIEDNKKAVEIIENTENIVEALVIIFKRQEEKRKTYSQAFIEDAKKYFIAVNANFFSCRENLKKFSATYVILEKGVQQGIVRKELKIELVDNFIHEILSLIHNSERLQLLNPDDADIQTNIFIPYFRGICTDKGIKLINQYFIEHHEN